MESDQPTSVLQERLLASEGALFRLATHTCAGHAAGDEDLKAVTAAAIAYGLSRALARFPADRAALLLVPHSLLADDACAVAEPAMVLENAALVSAVQSLAAMAREAHAAAIAGLRRRSRRDRLAYLPLAMVRPNLTALERGLQRPGKHPYEPLSFWRLIRIGWAHASGRL